MIYLLWNGGFTSGQPPVYTPVVSVYTHTTLGQAQSQLAARLQDGGGDFWSGTELNAYIVEALRTWNALTGFYRQRVAFSSNVYSAGTYNSFYDLPGVTGLTPFSYTVIDTQIVQVIQWQLIEPAAGTSWTGTDQFTYAQVSAALQNALNRFLQDTGVTVSWYMQSISPPPIGRVPLLDSTVDVRRVAFVDVNGVYYPLWRTDDFALDSFYPGWTQTPGIPRAYSTAALPPIELQLAPPPLSSGLLEVVSVSTSTPLDPAVGVHLNIPDDFTWGVKWGALSTLLSTDGQSRDPVRAAYCEQRYQHAVAAARLSPSLLRARVNDIPISTGSTFDADAFLNGWQNSPGRPRMAAMAGRNVLCLAPVPDQLYGISLDMVTNIPVPLGNGDYLQVGREDIGVILDYAQHLACFKMAGAEFDGTMKLLSNFLTEAMVRNGRLKASCVNKFDLEWPGLAQAEKVPRLEVKNAAS